MSRAYRISVTESLSREIVASDEVRSRLELLAILPPDETAALLRVELAGRGFEEQLDGTMLRKSQAIDVSVDPCNGEISVRIEAKQATVAQQSQSGVGFDDQGPSAENAEATLRRQLRKNLEQKLDRNEAKLQSEATRELESHLIELQPELGAIVNKVTRDALKIKATRLGSVTQILEDEQTGSLTITVEV